MSDQGLAPGGSDGSGSGLTEDSRGDGDDGWRPGDAFLDLSGEVCPFTFVRAKLLLEELPLGAALRLLVDHAPAAANVPRSATAWGQRVLAVTALDVTDGRARWHIDLRKLRD